MTTINHNYSISKYERAATGLRYFGAFIAIAGPIGSIPDGFAAVGQALVIAPIAYGFFWVIAWMFATKAKALREHYGDIAKINAQAIKEALGK